MRTEKNCIKYTFKTFICNQTHLNLPRKEQAGDGVAAPGAAPSGVAGGLGSLFGTCTQASFWAADLASWLQCL